MNTTAGFSVVTYTGTGAVATVGHGLGVAPSMVITKGRTTAGYNWAVYHASANASPGTGGLYLDTTSAFTSSIQFWNTPTGSNTIQRIASFNANEVDFTGAIYPQKGFIYTPNVISSNVTTFNIDIANSSLYKISCNASLSLSLSGFKSGKIVEVWLTNQATGGTQTITHGCSAMNSSINSTTFTIPTTSSAYLRYFSIDGDLANTYVSIQHG